MVKFNGKMITFLAVYFSFLFSVVYALEIRETPMPMTTSVIIPCHYSHFENISSLLRHYQNQTVIPDEVVVSISEVHHIPQEEIDLLEKENWMFKLIVLRNQGGMSAGANRNMASANSTGSLLICQDADDIPHPQRVEIIKFLFENYEINHLMHNWKNHPNFEIYDKIRTSDLCHYCSDYNYALDHFRFANGVPAFIRSLFDLVQWTDSSIAEDCAFNRLVYQKTGYNVIYTGNLYCYRNHLSTFFFQDPEEEKTERKEPEDLLSQD